MSEAATHAKAAIPDPAACWSDALHAAAVFAVDPAGLRGIAMRAQAGPVRERWVAALRACLPTHTAVQRIPAGVTEDRLLGGLDVVATLAARRPVVESGLLAASDGGVAVLAMGERVTATAAAHLAAALDTGEVVLERDGFSRVMPARFGLVLLDEGDGDDERPPAALQDRLAFHLDLRALSLRDASDAADVRAQVIAARARLREVRTDDALVDALCAAAAALGIGSLRAPLLALRAAQAAAALAGRVCTAEDDAAWAARLVLAPRATRLPQPAESPPPPSPPPPEERDDPRQDGGPSTAERSLEDRVLEAAQAALPYDVLSTLLQQGRTPPRAHTGGRVGAARVEATRGRPMGVRRGDLRSGARLHLLATLRAAAPWQPWRALDRAGGEPGALPRLQIRRDDFRLTRYRRRTQTTTIFVVDASGSSALHRLAEAKGAVQLLLAECYVRRDSVALLAFRGTGAELLLPPTRSLVRAKRCLADLPGGGGTPLAAGIDAAVTLADALRRRGQAPLIALFTDGRANIGRDGVGGRDNAERDALAAAAAARAAQLTILLVDTSVKPQERSQRLAHAMGARYLALPQAGSVEISQAVRRSSP